MNPTIKQTKMMGELEPEVFLPWIEAVAANPSAFSNTFVNIQNENAFATFGTGAGMNSLLKKKVASFGALPVQPETRRRWADEPIDSEDEEEMPPVGERPKKTLSRSNSWPTSGPSSDEVYMTAIVSKMFYKPTPAVSGLAQKRSVSFGSTASFQTDRSHSDDDDRSDNDWEEVAPNDEIEIEPEEKPTTKPITMVPAAEQRVALLPSVGSAGHFDGTCRPCCFKLRQRCSMGARCKHCHFEHEKILRPGKKTRDRVRRQRLRSDDNDNSEPKPDGVPDHHGEEDSTNDLGKSAGDQLEAIIISRNEDGWSTLRL